MAKATSHLAARETRGLEAPGTLRPQCHNLLLLIGALCLLGPASGVGRAQDFITSTGDRIPIAPEPVELGFIESTNGGLHLEIPLGSFPQRGSGRPVTYRLLYDSTIWTISPVGLGWGWKPGSGWNIFSANSTFSDRFDTDACKWTWSNFGWQDNDGTVHYFPIKTYYTAGSTCWLDTPSGDAFATDSSGYHMYVTTYWHAKVYAPDGRLVDQTPDVKDPNGEYIGAVDANGNYFSHDGTTGTVYKDRYFDTLGRAVVQ